MKATLPKILLVEDELILGQIVSDALISRGFELMYVGEGNKVLSAFASYQPDLILLDVMLPGRDGFELAKEIRQSDALVPIIFLTAKSQTEDVIKGFGSGCNDYIRKPYNLEELIVRMNALLQRSGLHKKEDTIFIIGAYRFDFIRQELIHPMEKIQLTSREADLLKRLCENRNQLTDKKTVLQELWGDDSIFNGRSMDVFITKLRKYLSHDPSISILNVRGAGYKLTF